MAMPGAAVRVHDGYSAGTGLPNALLAGVYSAHEMNPGRQLIEGELMRWLAEAGCYRNALLLSLAIAASSSLAPAR